MSKLTFAFVVVALLSTGCSVSADGPPQIVVDRTACSHCSMLVSEPIYAAAYQAGDSEPRVFDDIGCMLEAMRRAGLRAGGDTRLWFHDAGDREWIENGGAVFVRSSEIRTPMGGGIVAYRDAKRAEEAAARFHGDVVPSIAELVAVKGEQ
jgi:copper chaperone NosL